MNTKTNKREIGNIAENKAVAFLENQGYNIITRNYQKYCGEIDIIASKHKYIHFIEVKYRKSAANGYPREFVTKAKQNKIKNTALYYIQELHETHKNNIGDEIGFSFDVIEILDENINFLENAFF